MFIRPSFVWSQNKSLNELFFPKTSPFSAVNLFSSQLKTLFLFCFSAEQWNNDTVVWMIEISMFSCHIIDSLLFLLFLLFNVTHSSFLFCSFRCEFQPGLNSWWSWLFFFHTFSQFTVANHSMLLYFCSWVSPVLLHCHNQICVR